MAQTSKTNAANDPKERADFPRSEVQALVLTLEQAKLAAERAGAERILLREFDKVLRELSRAVRLADAALDDLRKLASQRAREAAAHAKRMVSGFAKEHERAVARAADRVLDA